MKVLIYVHEFPPFQGGIATSAEKIATIISSEHELMVCCPSYSMKSYEKKEPYQIKRINFVGGKNFKKIPLLQYFTGLLNLKKIVHNFQPDKIIYLGEEAELVGGMLNLNKAHQIVRVAGSGIEAIIKSSNPLKIISKYLLRKLYQNSKFIIAVSKNTEKLMANNEAYFKKEKIKMIYNGIDDNFLNKKKELNRRKELGIKEDDFVLLTVARLLPRKGQDFVIKALSEINQPNIKYLCVGEGRFEKQYRQLATSLGLKDRVIFAGGIENEKIHEYYDCANIFILCNRTWDSKIEGLPNVVIESMARSVPVIGSKNSGTEELILDGITGFLVDPYNINDVNEKIVRAYAMKDKLDKMGESAKIFVKDNFHYEKMRSEYLKLLANE